MPPVFKIYSSSAGSGKTYHLTKEYLKLALHTPNPEYYRSVLAITFTNDAAAEMKERILAALRQFNDLALPPAQKQKSDLLLQQLLTEMQTADPDQNLTEDTLRHRAKLVFEKILYNYSEFSVSTIDSFVNKVVTAFTKELEIPYNFEVDLDSKTLLQNAVTMLLDKIGGPEGNKLLTETLESYALEKADEGRSWNNLTDELAGFARNLLNEQVYEAVMDLQKFTLEDFRNIRTQLFKHQKDIEQAILNEAGAALSLMAEQDISASDLYYGDKGIFGYFSKYLKKFELASPNSYVIKTIETDTWYAGKTPAAVRLKIDQVKQTLTDHFREIQRIKESQGQAYRLVAEIVKHLNQVSVLNELEKCIQDIKYDKNLVHISEFNKRITDIVLNEPVPFIYERLGEKYNHILIDEFQDTSVLQWNNLLPLIENALSSGYFNMVVGDAKQAIYRWRGGEMEQILHLYKQNTAPLYEQRRNQDVLEPRYASIDYTLSPQNLQTNYRSAGKIIDFNNDFFTMVSQRNSQFGMLQAIYDEGFKQALPVGKTEGQGHIQVLFTHNDDTSLQYDLESCERTGNFYEGYIREELLTYQESTLNITLQLIRQAEADGYTWKDIAILNRTNYSSKITASFLKQKKIDIISQDSLLLQFAEVINLVIALFRIFNKADDGLARSEALYLFYKVVLQRLPANETAMQMAALSKNPDPGKFFDHLRQHSYDLEEAETGNLSVYELTEKIIRTFDLLGKNNECDYLFRFLDLVLEYSLTQSNNLNNFLQYWETHKDNLSINTPKNRNAITITSIHKAKGLAYPVVIVPFADWSLEPKRGSMLWSNVPAGIKLPANLQTAVVTLSKRLEETPLKEQYRAEMEKTFIENLNMLYVAFTRPVDRLYLVAHKKDFSSETNRKTVSYLLQEYLAEKGLWDENKLCYQIAREGDYQHHHAPDNNNQFYLDHFTSADWTKRLQIKQHANNVFDFETQQAHRRWNRKLHYALSAITGAAESDKVLRQLVNQGIISRKERPELEHLLNGIIDHPELSYYFSDKITFETEKEILDVRAIRYKPDRIVFDGEKVVLLDFRAPPEKTEYSGNLNFYAGLFHDLGYRQIDCIIYFFDCEEIKKWQYEVPVVSQVEG